MQYTHDGGTLSQLVRASTSISCRRRSSSSRALTDALRGRLDLEGGAVLLDELRMTEGQMWRLGRVYAVACGTAWHAALIGKYLMETLAKVRVAVDYGSEFRYRAPLLGDDTLLLAITQSGETIDTLAAMEEACAQQVKARGGHVIAIASAGDAHSHDKADYVIEVPETLPLLAPILTSIPMQLIAYHFAVRRGADVDQPRNLAKSVTVE